MDVSVHVATHCMSGAESCSNRGECSVVTVSVMLDSHARTNCDTCKDEVEHLLSHICDDCMLFYTDICFQRNTSNCDLALMVAACHALEVTLSSGSSLPQSCLTT